ncbi:hypothetical protein [Bacteroides bouchesdurhonensis]|uniref:hypothetical protein n=1 Tax=Bacteroides bouchesdurhonensis TaxID=1841855 RepID=UPI0022E039BA|nr:hypothetical protein [Bacteroides bouchesdurhonensis]
MKLPKFIRKYLIKKIKMRVIEVTQPNGDYQKATSFIVDAPLSEWRIRLWCVTHYKNEYGSGDESDWQNLLDYLTH